MERHNTAQGRAHTLSHSGKQWDGFTELLTGETVKEMVEGIKTSRSASIALSL